MKKIIKDVDKKLGIVQITTTDERVYIFPEKEKKTGLPEYKFKPSSTYILSIGYPKGKYFYEWAKKMGDEAEMVKILAGERGSKIHQGVEMLLKGEEIKINEKLLNPTTEQLEELSPEEYDALNSFKRFYDELKEKSKIEILGIEFIVNSDKYDYAGTVDILLRIDKKLWLIDVKSGQNIYEDYILQLSSYKNAIKEKGFNGKEINEDINLAILQVGYKRNKNKFKFTEIEDKFNIFLNAKDIFHNEVSKLPYTQVEYPLSLSIKI